MSAVADSLLASKFGCCLSHGMHAPPSALMIRNASSPVGSALDLEIAKRFAWLRDSFGADSSLRIPGQCSTIAERHMRPPRPDGKALPLVQDAWQDYFRAPTVATILLPVFLAPC